MDSGHVFNLGRHSLSSLLFIRQWPSGLSPVGQLVFLIKMDVEVVFYYQPLSAYHYLFGYFDALFVCVL